MYSIKIEKISLIDCGLDIHTFQLGFKSSGVTKTCLLPGYNKGLLIVFNENDYEKNIIFFPKIEVLDNGKFDTLDGQYQYEQIELTEEQIEKYKKYDVPSKQPTTFKTVDLF
jgi:hypothetical protein